MNDDDGDEAVNDSQVELSLTSRAPASASDAHRLYRFRIHRTARRRAWTRCRRTQFNRHTHFGLSITTEFRSTRCNRSAASDEYCPEVSTRLRWMSTPLSRPRRRIRAANLRNLPRPRFLNRRRMLQSQPRLRPVRKRPTTTSHRTATTRLRWTRTLFYKSPTL